MIDLILVTLAYLFESPFTFSCRFSFNPHLDASLYLAERRNLCSPVRPYIRPLVYSFASPRQYLVALEWTVGKHMMQHEAI